MKNIYINGIDYYYKDIGKGEEIILFLHGLGTTSSSWLYQIPFFKKKYRIIAPDLRGEGRSSLGDTPYSFTLCADDIALLLNKLNIKKVHICGFSLGGMIASQFAVKYPHLLLSICIVNALPVFNINTLKLKLAYQMRRFIARFIPLRIIIILIAWVLFPNHKYLQKRLIRFVSSINKKGYIAALDTMESWNIENEFIKLSIPTLFIGSQFDYKIFQNKKETCSKMKNGKYIEIENAHHFVIWEYAKTFNNTYNKFLNSLTKG
ncbi:MAG: alpha/beta hydrolase [Campylobacterota bacterium]|nr:alpha/beta hydrolase [Campylobacterota bacterium]